ncbi:lysoplasmalogenase [Psychroserpens luteolus]|uniref:lysoplasmalogenase n=1 Tax=Psychroserpens luteolus TaxID=2855840 RepID=UPI001E34406A|nr:lysoplasmalogenase [Psychroserpens luteolus]MCD2260900.1 lysoplasmalogenase [Psychroserpens luteolus]
MFALSKSEKIFSVIFALIVIAELITGNSEAYIKWHYFFKPAIVISLLVFFWKESKGLQTKLRYFVALALVCSLIGDVLLMFVEQSPNYFLFGLVSFLIAHIMYVIVFLHHRNETLKPLGFVSVLLLYAIGLFYVLKDGLNDMLIPVVVYMLIILSMSTAAFLRQKKAPRISFIFVLIGALLFMISDSLLALNKFYTPLAYSNISIILTYALAQYCIVFGLLKLSQTSR